MSGLRSRRSYGKIGDCEHTTLFKAKSTHSLRLVFHGNEANESSLNTASSIYKCVCFVSFQQKETRVPFLIEHNLA